jgi:hypothetical protein
MFLQRLVLLIAITYLGPGPGGDRFTASAYPNQAGPAAVDRAPSSFVDPAATPHARLSRLAPWRHRIKSVLEEKVAWHPQSSDRGPADLPDLIEPWTSSAAPAPRRRSLNALRC